MAEWCRVALSLVSIFSVKRKQKSLKPLSRHRKYETRIYRALLYKNEDLYNETEVIEPEGKTKLVATGYTKDKESNHN